MPVVEVTEDRIRVVPIWRIVAGGLIVVGIISILCWFGWCWWCPDCPDVDCCDEVDPEPAAAQIILEDMHAGVWMALESGAFEFDTSNPTQVCTDTTKSAFGECEGSYEAHDVYRHGVLFQMGPVVELEPLSKTVKDMYGGVYIKHDGGEAWLIADEANDFDWLDVMATGTKCVIDPFSAYSMLHSPNNLDSGTNLDTHFNNGHLTDLAPNACDSPTPTLASPSDFLCRRDRSIHASQVPTRIITYWAGPGPEFYEVSARPTEEIPYVRSAGTKDPTHHQCPTAPNCVPHVSYHFRLPEKVVVDHWKNGCREKRYTGVETIRILHDYEFAFHLGYPHRPIDGEY